MYYFFFFSFCITSLRQMAINDNIPIACVFVNVRTKRHDVSISVRTRWKIFLNSYIILIMALKFFYTLLLIAALLPSTEILLFFYTPVHVWVNSSSGTQKKRDEINIFSVVFGFLCRIGSNKS